MKHRAFNSRKKENFKQPAKPTSKPTPTTPPAATRHRTRRGKSSAIVKVWKYTRRPASISLQHWNESRSARSSVLYRSTSAFPKSARSMRSSSTSAASTRSKPKATNTTKDCRKPAWRAARSTCPASASVRSKLRQPPTRSSARCSTIWKRGLMLTPANRDHGPKLRRLLVGQDGLRRSQTLARIDRLGRWRTLFF